MYQIGEISRQLPIIEFSDGDWAGDVNNRKSIYIYDVWSSH